MLLLSIAQLFIFDASATCLEACLSHSSFPGNCARYPTQIEACQATHKQCEKQCSVVEVTASDAEQTLFSDVQIGLVEGAMKSCPDSFRAYAVTRIPELRSCHVDSLKSYPEVTGRLVVDVDLENGTVFRAQAKQNTTADSALARCVQRELKRWNLGTECTDLISMTLEFQPMAESYAKGDLDGDGVINYNDAFPRDPKESADADGDGVGDNSDAFVNDPTENVDSDNTGVGDKAEEEAIQTAEYEAIEDDFRKLQKQSDERRNWKKNAYKEIKESLDGKEMIYKSNAELKEQWLALTAQRKNMKNARNTKKMSKYLEQLEAVASEIKRGHKLVVTDEKYESIPESERSRTVYVFPPKEVEAELFSIRKEVGARIEYWEGEDPEVGVRLDVGANNGASLYFHTGNRLHRDYELFAGSYLLTPEVRFSVEVLPWALKRTDVLLRTAMSYDLESAQAMPSVGVAFRYEFRSFWSLTGTVDVNSFDDMQVIPGASLGYKWVKKF